VKRFIFAALGVFLFVAVICDRQPALADCRSLSPALRNGGLLAAFADGRIITACNPDQSFIPASILKIVTALIALRVLGQDFHFQSEWYLDAEQNLYLRGYGDPFLVAEEVAMILDRLRDLGVARINNIFVDNGSYDLAGQVPGRGTSANPYDVPVSATAVNFNTVAFRVGPDKEVRSAEAQTPTLPLMRELARGLQPGEYRLNICPGQCQPEARSARYVAELLRALQREKGIAGDGSYGIRPVPAGATLLYSHRNTRGLGEVLAAFLEHSNNYVANQVYLACGAARYDYPATWAKASQVAAETLTGLLGQESAGQVRMVEGSGLSRENRVTARAMLKVLQVFAPYAGLLREQDGVRLKSGSMAGVHNYAGYLTGGRPFVILENQPANTRDGLLKQLRTMYPEEGS
jgi:D-alanyl-D-alanine carboxypeptidase/D-alanyl-D-alanine-endopeptidase (penicillin-binding protein 4)